MSYGPLPLLIQYSRTRPRPSRSPPTPPPRPLPACRSTTSISIHPRSSHPHHPKGPVHTLSSTNCATRSPSLTTHSSQPVFHIPYPPPLPSPTKQFHPSPHFHPERQRRTLKIHLRVIKQQHPHLPAIIRIHDPRPRIDETLHRQPAARRNSPIYPPPNSVSNSSPNIPPQ